MHASNPDQQQQSSGNIFVWIDEMHASMPRMMRWILAVAGTIIGFCYANAHRLEEYTILLVVLGFFGGLLLLQIVAYLFKTLVALLICGAVALLIYWLFGYQSTHKHQQGVPTSQTRARV